MPSLIRPSNKLERANEILEMQKKINEFYFVLGMNKKIEEDGIKGRQTVRAIKEVQRILKLMNLYKGRIDGIWGKLTEKAFQNLLSLYREKHFDVELRLEPLYFIAGKRYHFFVNELSKVLEKYNISRELVFDYLVRNKERAIELQNKIMNFYKNTSKKPDKDVVGHVVLAALSVEAVFGMRAEFILGIARAESNFSNVFSVNGKGVMQITKNSAVTHLNNPYWKERVNKLFGFDLIKQNVKYNELPIITFNIFSSAETIALKLAERKMHINDLSKDPILKKIALHYNGHPLHKERYSQRVFSYYKKLRLVKKQV